MSLPYYTAKGDDGTTGLLGEGRVQKDDARIEALGSVDEASAAFGAARSFCAAPESAAVILHIQRDLYGLMGELAASPENQARFRVIKSEQVKWLEDQIDALGQKVKLPREFILPGDSRPGGLLDLARAVVRRAERRVAALAFQKEIENPDLLRYLNRLSSLVFLLELWENQTAGNSNPTLAKVD